MRYKKKCALKFFEKYFFFMGAPNDGFNLTSFFNYFAFNTEKFHFPAEKGLVQQK